VAAFGAPALHLKLSSRKMTRKRQPNDHGQQINFGVQPKVRIEASAKVGATAKYEVKKTIHEVIPEDGMERNS